MTEALIVGLPNAGKTSLFNHWTQKSMPVGNWSGVTVSVIKGQCIENKSIELVDLPGIHSLCFSKKNALPEDAQITHDYLRDKNYGLIINVVDVRYIIRDLYLTTQLAELGKPMIVCLTFSDRYPYTEQIQSWIWHALGIKAVVANPQNKMAIDWEGIGKEKLPDTKRFNDLIQSHQLFKKNESLPVHISNCGWNHNQLIPDNISLLLADIRYQVLQNEVGQYRCTQNHDHYFDQWLLRPWWGGLIFIMTMVLFFTLSIGFGGGIQEGFSSAGIYIINNIVGESSPWINCVLVALLLCVSFWPILCVTYFLQAILSESGYVPRMVFNVDRWFRKWNLSGQSFIPILLGFGCNVPAIMATRALPYRNDRLITALMIPFIACSARLNLCILFSLAFFPTSAIPVVLLLYFLSVLIAGVVGYIAGYFLSPKDAKPLIQQLPALQLPKFRLVFNRSCFKSNRFVIRMSKTIIPLLVVLQLMGSFSLSDNVTLLEACGKILLPFFEPMGLTHEAWPLMIALMAGLIAKEVMLGALMGVLVMGVGDLGPSQWLLDESLMSFSSKIFSMTHLFFKDSRSVFSFLVFVVFYVPCIATLASFSTEFGQRWAVMSFVLSLVIGYSLSLVLYLSPLGLIIAVSLMIAFLTVRARIKGGKDVSFGTG